MGVKEDPMEKVGQQLAAVGCSHGEARTVDPMQWRSNLMGRWVWLQSGDIARCRDLGSGTPSAEMQSDGQLWGSEVFHWLRGHHDLSKVGLLLM